MNKTRKQFYLLLSTFMFVPFLMASVTIDSLQQALDQARTDTARLEIINGLIKQHLWNHTEVAQDYALMYDSIAQLTEDEKFIGKGQNFIGMCYHVKGQTVRAVEYYLKAIKHFEKAKDTLFIGILYNNIGVCFKEQEKKDACMEYYKKALDYFTLANNEEWINNLRINLAIESDEAGKHDEAIAYELKALEYYRKTDNKHQQGHVLSNLSASYFYKEEYEKSLNAALESLEFINEEEDVTIFATSHNNIGLSYLYLGQAHLCKFHLDKALRIGKEHRALIQQRASLKGLVDYYKAVGDYENAVSTFETYETVKDSIYNEVKNKAIVDATTRFETEKKEQEIALLNTKNEVQALKLSQAHRQSVFYGMGLLGLGVLALMLLYAFQVKRQALDEKELLLKEIHHRVKNNLQIVTSMLNIQQRRIKDEQTKMALQESKTRIESMALIHKSLYQNNKLSDVNAKNYINELMDYIFTSFQVDQEKVGYQLDIQAIKLDMDKLIPLGLIITELVTNAIKHAFSQEDTGVITVGLQESNNQVMLSVEDNGVGIPDEKIMQSSNSFGYRMVQAFVRKLNANLVVDRSNGTRMEITF